MNPRRWNAKSLYEIHFTFSRAWVCFQCELKEPSFRSSRVSDACDRWGSNLINKLSNIRSLEWIHRLESWPGHQYLRTVNTVLLAVLSERELQRIKIEKTPVYRRGRVLPTRSTGFSLWRCTHVLFRSVKRESKKPTIQSLSTCTQRREELKWSLWAGFLYLSVMTLSEKNTPET